MLNSLRGGFEVEKETISGKKRNPEGGGGDEATRPHESLENGKSIIENIYRGEKAMLKIPGTRRSVKNDTMGPKSREEGW